MLFLVGLGLSVVDIPIGAIEVCKRCDLYIDNFTSFVTEEITDYIRSETGKQMFELSRPDMEENVKEIVKRASGKDIAILVGGDPLMATTHKIIYIESKRQGVTIEIIHANSIITTAIGESGLDFYRFGAPCTIPDWSEHYSPVSFYEKLYVNLRNNEHTIMLLDYNPKAKRTLTVSEAVEKLLAAESHYKKGIISYSTKIIIMHNMSQSGKKIIMSTIGAAKPETYEGINILILPAALSDVENKAVSSIIG